MSFRMNSLPDGWATFPGQQRQALDTRHVLSSEILLKFQGLDASRADFQVIPWPWKSGILRRGSHFTFRSQVKTFEKYITWFHEFYLFIHQTYC